LYRPPAYDLNSPFSVAFQGNGLFADHTATAPAFFPTTLDPEIRIELTDPMVTSTLAGNAVDGQGQQVARTCSMAVTTYGETLPTVSGAGSAGIYGTAGLEVGRARISFLSFNDNCK